MIVLMGIKHTGKTILGKMTAKALNLPFLDLDDLLEEQYSKDRLFSFRELYMKLGETGFRELEIKAINSISMNKEGILALGGGTIENIRAMERVKKAALLVFLDTEEEVLYKRIKKNGFPSFLEKSPEKLFHELFIKRRTLYSETADITLKLTNESPEEVLHLLIKKIEDK
jgi:shikimate kinase